MGKKIWMASTSEEYWSGEDYVSKEEAIKEGAVELDVGEDEVFYVGVKEQPEIDYPDEDFFELYLDDLLENKNEETLGEWAESWLVQIRGSKQVKEFFKTKMEEIAQFIETTHKPTFYMVGSIEQVTPAKVKGEGNDGNT